jgi:hypothetical protein
MFDRWQWHIVGSCAWSPTKITNLEWYGSFISFSICRSLVSMLCNNVLVIIDISSIMMMLASLRIWNSTLNSCNGRTYLLHCIWNVLLIVEAFELSLDATHPVVVVRITFFSITYSIRSNIEWKMSFHYQEFLT